jgi:hypothetical protein
LAVELDRREEKAEAGHRKVVGGSRTADLVGDFGATRRRRQVENLEQVGSLERGKPSSVTER